MLQFFRGFANDMQNSDLITGDLDIFDKLNQSDNKRKEEFNKCMIYDVRCMI